MAATRYPFREAIGLALAWLDGDDEVLAEIVAGYDLGRDELELLVSVLSLISLGRDEDDLGDLLYEVSLVGAGSRRG